MLAIEDHNFYNHGAIDVDGILRATLVNITAGEVVQGGSTITQQLTKNLFLSQEQTLIRKTEEALLSLVMEQHYSKDQLLEIYFNTTYFGAGATGIKSAALTYFDKLPQEMQLAECAIIAALPYAHHGSSTSSTYNFLKAVQPQLALISCGDKEKYNHPNKKVLGTFEYLQIPVKVTSQNGEITLRTDGEKYQIMTDK